MSWYQDVTLVTTSTAIHLGGKDDLSGMIQVNLIIVAGLSILAVVLIVVLIRDRRALAALQRKREYLEKHGSWDDFENYWPHDPSFFSHLENEELTTHFGEHCWLLLADIDDPTTIAEEIVAIGPTQETLHHAMTERNLSPEQHHILPLKFKDRATNSCLHLE